MEWYIRICDVTMGRKYKRWVERIKDKFKAFKGKGGSELVIDWLNEILPLTPRNLKVPF